MSDYPASLPIQQFFDDNGNPLSGGKLYSYVAGTSTPQATYATAGGTPNTNPIILDASGKATYYLPTGVGYKFNLTTATDVQVTGYPVDNVMIPSPATPPSPLAVPTGAILPYGGSAAPSGYFLCDGTAVDRTTYAALFTVIGTTYGVGDGSTTFNVPDLRQRFPLGKAASGTGSVLGATGGAIDHTHTYTQVVNHTHTISITDPGHNHTQNAHTHTVTDPGHTHTQQYANTTGTTGGATNAIIPTGTTTTGSSTTGITLGNATATNNSTTTGISASSANPGGGVATGTTDSQNPPYVTVNYVIKA
jgi:microcystin-dependent protein